MYFSTCSKLSRVFISCSLVFINLTISFTLLAFFTSLLSPVNVFVMYIFTLLFSLMPYTTIVSLSLLSIILHILISLFYKTLYLDIYILYLSFFFPVEKIILIIRKQAKLACFFNLTFIHDLSTEHLWKLWILA